VSANPRQEKCRIICDVTNTTCLFLHKTPRCVFNYKYQFILCTAWCFCAPIIGIHILYIKMNVCLFVPYTNPHFWTDRNQTLHKTHPWSGRDRSGSHVCVCVGSPCVYIPSSTSSSCFVLSGKCFANGMTTLWSMLLTWATICCMLESRKPYKHLHYGSWRENKELQWHFKQTVTFQFRYISLLSY